MKATRQLLVVAVAMILMTGAAGVARAETVVFDFEDQAATRGLSSLSLAKSGLEVTITRPGSVFDVENLSPDFGFPASYGSRALSPFSDFASATPFIAGFSRAVDAVSIDVGDIGQDADTITLLAFSGPNGTGGLLGAATELLPGGGTVFTGTTLSLVAAGIRSIRFIGGTAEVPQSVFFDNLTVTFTPAGTVIPEPSTLALCAPVALLAGGAWLRRKRRAA